MKSTFFVTMAAFASLTGALAVADDSHVPAAVKEKVDTVCQSCHGAQGNSVSSTFPRLNGQQADYIAAQLKNFRDHSRTDPHARAYMWGMASQLDDATIDGLAKYFASQKPSQPQGGGELAAEGKKIYMDGADAQNVPACQACHGEHGEGNSVIPRLAGQHRGLSEGADGGVSFDFARKRHYARQHQGYDRPPDRSIGVLSRKRLTGADKPTQTGLTSRQRRCFAHPKHPGSADRSRLPGRSLSSNLHPAAATSVRCDANTCWHRAL